MSKIVGMILAISFWTAVVLISILTVRICMKVWQEFKLGLEEKRKYR